MEGLDLSHFDHVVSDLMKITQETRDRLKEQFVKTILPDILNECLDKANIGDSSYSINTTDMSNAMKKFTWKYWRLLVFALMLLLIRLVLYGMVYQQRDLLMGIMNQKFND